MNSSENTYPKLILRNYKEWGDRHIAMMRKELGIWQAYTWKEYYEEVKYISLGLLSVGIGHEDRVCIIGDNEPELLWTQFATQAAGGIPVILFSDAIPSEIEYIANHCEAKFAVAEDQEQVDKFLSSKDKIPSLKKIIYWDPKGLARYDDPILLNLREVIKLGQEYEAAHPGLFEQSIEQGKGSDVAALYYTSGTTGLAKGVVLTHNALLGSGQAFLDLVPLDSDDRLFSLFPAAWIGDPFFSTVPHLITGAVLAFPEEPETIQQDLREVAPNFVCYGPRQWESIVSMIQVKMTDAHWLKRFCYRLALPIGYKQAELRFEGKSPSIFWRTLNQLAYWLLFRPLKDKVGLNNLKAAITGSSALSLDTFKLIHGLGIPLRQAYAGTEGGFISGHKEVIDFETIGPPVKGTEIKVTDRGEAAVRSDCIFSGYFKDPDKTKECLKDGWFYTGDALNITGDGHLVFLDRLADLGELATGVKYAPQYIEGRLRFSPWIKDAFVTGGKDRDYPVAVVNIDFDMVGKWAEQNRISFTTFTDLSQKPEIAELIRKDLRRVNRFLPEGSKVLKFTCLHKEFDPDEAELTRTRKLRRGFIETKYNDMIEAMYADKQEVLTRSEITYRDDRKGVITTAVKIRRVEEGN